MLTLLTIKNIALIDSLSIEFGSGLNLLTGETGSGKSIIVDSLGALTGDRVSMDLIKSGTDSASIEGLFSIGLSPAISQILEEGGIESEPGEEAELIVRRELSAAGKNRIFLNGQLVTQSFLKRVGPYLVDIHGQGEQASLYNINTHISLLDRFADNAELLDDVAGKFAAMSAISHELAALERDESERLQVMDLLKFQVGEIEAAGLSPDEDNSLEDEKRKLNNVEKLKTLSSEAFALLYDNSESTFATLDKAARKVEELTEYESRFADYSDGLSSARAVIEDLAISIRDFEAGLDYSPERLEAIETRLAEMTRLKRKYGGSIDLVLEHLESSRKRLENIETAEFRRSEIQKDLAEKTEAYRRSADKLHARREKAAREYEKQVIKNLQAVALDKARFEVRIGGSPSEQHFTEKGYDSVEFYFSANPGESPRPLAKVASGGEASRLMLVLKTTGTQSEATRTTVFDEIDVGIGGRVAEAVGRKLKQLSDSQQVLCVTHQPQIASLADKHFIVEKRVARDQTVVTTRELDPAEKIEEIARMLAGETVTEAARQNARAMLAAS